MEISEQERPREKVLRYGIEQCSNRDLLAIILRSGVKGKSVLELADQLLSMEQNLAMITRLTYEELIQIRGIKKAKAIVLLACFELSKRISSDQVISAMCINNPSNLSEWLNKKIGFKDQEHFMVIFLGTKNQILKDKTIFIGSLDRTIIHPREIYKEAIKLNASKIICVHNHPSGDVTPSPNDIVATQAISEVGKTVGIPLLDHLIVGNNHYLSFREQGLLPQIE